MVVLLKLLFAVPPIPSETARERHKAVAAYVVSWLTPQIDYPLYERVVEAILLMESAYGLYNTIRTRFLEDMLRLNVLDPDDKGLLQTPVEIKQHWEACHTLK